MPENDITKKILPAPTGKSTNDWAFFGRPLILGINTFILLGLLFSLLIYQRYELVKESNRKKAYEILNQAKERIKETLSHSLSVAKTMALFIDKNGTVNTTNYNTILKVSKKENLDNFISKVSRYKNNTFWSRGNRKFCPRCFV